MSWSTKSGVVLWGSDSMLIVFRVMSLHSIIKEVRIDGEDKQPNTAPWGIQNSEVRDLGKSQPRRHPRRGQSRRKIRNVVLIIKRECLRSKPGTRFSKMEVTGHLTTSAESSKNTWLEWGEEKVETLRTDLMSLWWRKKKRTELMK